MRREVVLDQDILPKDLPARFGDVEYENCRFLNCQLNKHDLSHAMFVDCSFEGCDLSMANIADAGFRKVHFKECKLLGLRFEHSTPLLFEVSFDNCQLNLASFYGMKLKGASFINCEMQETDLTEADLTQATITNCNLTGAMFDRTDLTKADLRGSEGFQIDPVENKVKGAQFSRESLDGLLGRFQIRIDQ